MKKRIAAGAAAIWFAFTVSGCGGIDEKALPAEARFIEFDDRTAEDYQSFHQFLANYEAGQSDWIRVLTHTAEGEPVYGDVKYDGKRVEFTIDTTHGILNGNKIETYTCDPKLEKVTEDRMTVSNFTDCNNDSGILTLFYE